MHAAKSKFPPIREQHGWGAGFPELQLPPLISLYLTLGCQKKLSHLLLGLSLRTHLDFILFSDSSFSCCTEHLEKQDVNLIPFIRKGAFVVHWLQAVASPQPLSGKKGRAGAHSPWVFDDFSYFSGCPAPPLPELSSNILQGSPGWVLSQNQPQLSREERIRQMNRSLQVQLASACFLPFSEQGHVDQ